MARKTKEEAQATRSRILDAAEQVFQARGVSRSSLQDIAAAAGVTRGAVYWHFQDKADVFNAMMDRVILPMEEASATLDNNDDQPALPALRERLVDVLASVMQDAQVRRVLEIALHKCENIDELRAMHERRRELRRRYRARLERKLKHGQLRGEGTRALPAAHLAIGLHALIDGLIHNWLLDPAGFVLLRVGTQTIDMHLAGLAPG